MKGRAICDATPGIKLDLVDRPLSAEESFFVVFLGTRAGRYAWGVPGPSMSCPVCAHLFEPDLAVRVGTADTGTIAVGNEFTCPDCGTVLQQVEPESFAILGSSLDRVDGG